MSSKSKINVLCSIKVNANSLLSDGTRINATSLQSLKPRARHGRLVIQRLLQRWESSCKHHKNDQERVLSVCCLHCGRRSLFKECKHASAVQGSPASLFGKLIFKNLRVSRSKQACYKKKNSLSQN